MDEEGFPLPRPGSADGGRMNSQGVVPGEDAPRGTDGARLAIDEEVLTYREAARLLKISARTCCCEARCWRGRRDSNPRPPA